MARRTRAFTLEEIQRVLPRELANQVLPELIAASYTPLTTVQLDALIALARDDQMGASLSALPAAREFFAAHPRVATQAITWAEATKRTGGIPMPPGLLASNGRGPAPDGPVRTDSSATRQRVLTFFADGQHHSVRDVAEALELSQHTSREHVQFLFQNGDLVQDAVGESTAPAGGIKPKLFRLSQHGQN